MGCPMAFGRSACRVLVVVLCHGGAALGDEGAARDARSLAAAKAALIRGDARAAASFLGDVRDLEGRAALVRARYEALLLFTEGRWDEVLDALSAPAFREDRRFREICLVKLAAGAAAGRTGGMGPEFDHCLRLNRPSAAGRRTWLRALRGLLAGEGASVPDADGLFADAETAAAWMKLALYLDRERDVLDHVEAMPAGLYGPPVVRELLALLYFRDGNADLALRFVEDVRTPNADNIRGDAALAEGRHEEALGHFRRVLEKKPNSLNALVRALPATWALGLWREGLGYLARIPEGRVGESGRLALRAAFRVKLGDWEGAGADIGMLRARLERSRPRPPLALHLMDGLVGLLGGGGRAFESGAARACARLDGTSCWLLHQRLIWDDFGRTIRRRDPVHSAGLDLDALGRKAEVRPLTEEVLIDQREIERLDGLW